MGIYRVYSQNAVVGEFISDDVQLLQTGQILIKNEGIVEAIFSQECNVVNVNSYYISRSETITKEIEKTQTEILDIDQNFGNDMLLKDKSPEEAYNNLRKISNILNKLIEKIS